MKTQIVTGILDYCDVEHGELEILYGSIEDTERPLEVLSKAAQLGADF